MQTNPHPPVLRSSSHEESEGGFGAEYLDQDQAVLYGDGGIGESWVCKRDPETGKVTCYDKNGHTVYHTT